MKNVLWHASLKKDPVNKTMAKLWPFFKKARQTL
jgi:hypothetical protein